MKKIAVEEKYILEYIKDTINNLKIGAINEDNARFHHNTDYKSAPSIIKHGILSLRELNRLGLRHDSKEMLEIMDDTESHINGIDGVSLSVVGLKDNDRNKFLYDPFQAEHVDFLVDNNISASRSGYNYDNEFICRHAILPNMIHAVDIRLLEYANIILKDPKNRYCIDLEGLIKKYNALKTIALALKESNLDIALREMSDNSFNIDIDKAAQAPTLVLDNKFKK